MSEKHYKIGEFANLVGLSTFTLRYYESEGLIKPGRDDAGLRFYTDQDIKWLGFLLHLKGTGMKITDLKRYIQLRAQGDVTIPERQAMLERVQEESRAELAELQEHLKILTYKIEWYKGKVTSEISEDETFENYLQRFNDEGESINEHKK